MTTKHMSAKAISFFVVVAAFLFVFTTAAHAQFTITGKVVSINDSSKILTIEPTVKDPQLGAGPISFSLMRTDPYDRNTFRMADIRDASDRSVKLSDIHKGDWVTINYHQEATGQYAADGIMVGAAGVAPQAGFTETREVTQLHPDQYRTYPQGRTEVVPLSLTGKVIAIDKFAKTFTLDPSYGRSVPADRTGMGLRTFALERNGIVFIGNERREFNDLTIGDLVTVSYRYESAGKILAEHVTLLPVYPGTVAGPQASVVPGSTYYHEPLAKDRMMRNTFSAETTPFSLMGKVVSIDRNAGTITIDSSQFRDAAAYNKAAGGVTTLVLGKDISIQGVEKDLALSDLKVGDTVSVSYHQESDGNIVADAIAINPPLAPFPEERG